MSSGQWVGGPGSRYRLVDEQPGHAFAEIEVDGFDEPYATPTAAGQEIRAATRSRAYGDTSVTDTVLDEIRAWYEDRPDTRPRRWRRYLTGLPSDPVARQATIGEQVAAFVQSRHDLPEEEKA